MRTLVLSVSGRTTLDISGNGTVQLGPAVPGHVWYPNAVSIFQTGNFPSAVNGTPVVNIYAGNGTSSGDLVDTAYQVLGAASSVIDGQVLYPGQNVFAVFSFCNPGATVTLNVNGTRSVP